MTETISAVYERGILRPLLPLNLPEQTQVQLHIITPIAPNREEVRRVLLAAGVIQPRTATTSMVVVSETDLAAAAHSLAVAGPISDLILAERDQ